MDDRHLPHRLGNIDTELRVRKLPDPRIVAPHKPTPLKDGQWYADKDKRVIGRKGMKAGSAANLFVGPIVVYMTMGDHA